MTGQGRLRWLGRLVTLMPALLLAGAGWAGDATWSECNGPDAERRMAACTRLIETPELDPLDRSLAYAMRALAFSMMGQHALSIPDYDAALRINPEFPTALNNRAWALYKAGQASAGIANVERALELAPLSPHALDTRAHIRQVLGDSELALADYKLAMRAGGERMVKLYQCGLQVAGLYDGAIDGVVTGSLTQALAICVERDGCDPLPADEECRKATS